MPLTQLTYMQTIYNSLGKACFDFRREKNIWDGRNVAALEMKLKSRLGYYTFVAASSPGVSTHSEEFIIDMFDLLDDIEDSDVEQMMLYTEYKPCVTERKHTVNLMEQFADYSLITKATQTIKHKGCKHWLAARFGDFQVYHTIVTKEDHEQYRGWMKTFASSLDLGRSRVIYFNSKPDGFQATYYKCSQGVLTKVEPAKGDIMITCPHCSSYAVIEGFQPKAMSAFG